MTSLEEKLTKLKRGKLEILKKEGLIKKEKHGGKRKGSGRKVNEQRAVVNGIKDYIEKHYSENIKIEVVDPKTGKSIIIEKPRVVRALEVLYDIGVKDRNPEALNKWLNRALGMPSQQIEHTGGIELQHDITPEMAEGVKAYEATRNIQILEESKKHNEPTSAKNSTD